ncbi:MAG: hypothetical protein ACI9SC_001853 [Gammaproteobacteria bacterium]|jgi:hypothetical protein
MQAQLECVFLAHGITKVYQMGEVEVHFLDHNLSACDDKDAGSGFTIYIKNVKCKA